jgi:dissimilatory sulfite reductase related protein
MRTRPDVMSEEIIGGQVIRRDEAGYLVDPDDWSKDVAEHFAADEGIDLGDDHWTVLEFMRNYLAEHGIAADARFTFRYLGEHHGESVKAARRRFFILFPYGYTKQACKIAGMRQPRAWSTG